MKIGDVVTLPEGIHIDPEALRYALNRRGATAAAANAKVHNARRNGARAVMREVERREHAAKDPFEQARLYLGRRGIPVFSAAVYREDFGEATARRLIEQCGWVVGQEQYPTREEVLSRARADGWPG